MAQTTPINTGYTIINGTTSGSNGSKVNTWIEWKVTAQSTVNNTSTLDVYLYSQATTSLGTIWERSGNYGYVQVDSGTKQYTNLPNGYNFQNKHLNTFAHHTFTVNHNSDGTKTLTLNGAWDKGSSTSSYITGGTVSGQITLPQIARASTIPNFTCNLGSQGTISITRQSSSFTHTITYSIGGSTGTIVTKTSSASVSWTPPVSLITEITNATSKTGTLTCTTYSGNTAIGTSTSTLTLKVPNSTISDITAELGVSKTITVTNPCSTQLTYVVTYKFPSTATAVQIWSSTSKTYSYAFPTSLAAQISNAVSGTGTITVQTKNGTASVGTASATLTLSIPKASIGNISATMGTAKTITINNYGMSSLEYKITYSFGSSSGTVTNRTSSTSINYTFPTSLVTQIPNAASGTGTLTITTYNGTTTIGSRTSTLTLTAQASAVPTGSLTLTINNSNPTISGWGIAVQGYSTITASLTGTGHKVNDVSDGSTISQMSLSDGISATASYSTSPATLTATSPVITSTGTFSVTPSVIDSRGRSASVAAQSVTVWQYSLPTLSDVSLARCLSDGTLDTSGTYLKTVYTAGYSSLDGNNTATVKVQYKLVGANSWTTYSGAISSGGAYNIPLDVSKNYVARLQIQDALNTVYSTEISIPSGSRILNVNPSGKSLAIGGFADINAEDVFKVYWDSEFGSDVSFGGAVSVNGNLPVGGNLSVVGDISGDDITGSSLVIDGHNMLNGLVYKALLTSADDLNDIEESGIYYFGSTLPSNAPPTARSYAYLISLTAMISASTIRQQIYIRPILTQGSSNMCMRAYSGGTWSNWIDINDISFAKGVHQITLGTSLNEYDVPGVYYCENTSTATSLYNTPYTEGIWDGGSGFRLETAYTTAYGYGYQRLYPHAVSSTVFHRTWSNERWSPWHRVVWDDEVYYTNRDTQLIKTYTTGGYLTSSKKTFRFSIPLPKSMANVTPIITTLKLNVWISTGGYLLGSAYVDGGYDILSDSALSVSLLKCTDNAIRVEVSRSSAFTNGTNNTPVGIDIARCVICFGTQASVTALPTILTNGVKQGGCSDGTYLYQISATDSYATMTFIKYKISDGTFTTTVFTNIDFGHGNDMTYNPNTGYLYILTSHTDTPIQVLKASDMSYVGSISIVDEDGNAFAPVMICYDRTNDKFYIGQDNKMLIYDSSFNYESYVWLSTLPDATRQTMETDGTYVYRLTYQPNLIVKDTLMGRNVETYQLPISDEPEAIIYDWNSNYYVSQNTVYGSNQNTPITNTVVFYSLTMP